MKVTFVDFVVHQRSTVPPVEHADLSGQTVVIIGGNTGIGFEAAKHFACMGPAKLVLGCRSERKCADAVSAIESATRFKSCQGLTLDLADFASVMRFSERFQEEHDRLDILVMNAAALACVYEETVDGWESSLQVNYLGMALLSLLLLPCIADTGKRIENTTRLVIVSSSVHYWATLTEDVKRSSNPVATLSGPDYRNAASMRSRYEETKLLTLLFARALQDRLQTSTPVTVTAVCPGYCYSSLRRSLPSTFARVMHAIMETCLAWTAEQGGRQLVYAAVGGREDEDRMKGAFINLAAVREPSDFVISAEGNVMQDNLWRETVEVLLKKAPLLESVLQAYLD